MNYRVSFRKASFVGDRNGRRWLLAPIPTIGRPAEWLGDTYRQRFAVKSFTVSMAPDSSAPDRPLFRFGEASAETGHDLADRYGHLISASSDERADATDADATVPEFLEHATRAHALAVVGELMCSDEPLRFSDFQERLAISPKTLSARLSELVELGFGVRRSYDEIPPRVEYELTDDGAALAERLEPLLRWAEDR
jgi:DNA-binding HxlR family transcriptional regulator